MYSLLLDVAGEDEILFAKEVFTTHEVCRRQQCHSIGWHVLYYRLLITLLSHA